MNGVVVRPGDTLVIAMGDGTSMTDEDLDRMRRELRTHIPESVGIAVIEGAVGFAVYRPAENDEPVSGRDYDPMPGEHAKRCPCKWCHPCVNCGLPVSSNRNGYYHAPGNGQDGTGCADPVPSNMQRYEPTRLPLRNDQHAFEQADAMVKVCVCGKWPMHHAHLGISAETCSCDDCRSRRDRNEGDL